MAPFVPRPRPVGSYFGKCDFCEKEVMCVMVPLGGNVYFGWTACSDCRDEACRAQDSYTYPIEKLKREFPRGIKVRRSSGVLEDNWTFMAEGVLGEEGEILVNIENKENKVWKRVPLSLLREWGREDEKKA